jgi:hypothetical protein
MNKNNEHSTESAGSDRIAANEQDSISDNNAESRESVKKIFSVSDIWKIRRHGRVFRIHSRLSRI